MYYMSTRLKILLGTGAMLLIPNGFLLGALLIALNRRVFHVS